MSYGALGSSIMGYTHRVLASAFFLATPLLSYAQAPVVEESGPSQKQLEKMAQSMKECRLETNKVMAALDNDARTKKSGAIYHLDAPNGVQVFVDKATFADFYLASCYQDKLAADTELNQSNYVADGTPIS